MTFTTTNWIGLAASLAFVGLAYALLHWDERRRARRDQPATRRPAIDLAGMDRDAEEDDGAEVW